MNIGSADRAIRLIVAIILVGLYFGGVITGKFGLALVILGAGLGITALVRFCGLYTLLGINTCCSGEKDSCCCGGKE